MTTPTTPYAKVIVSQGGGAYAYGALTLTPGVTVQLSAANKIGWEIAVWTIYGPPGWSVPAGWSTVASGIAQYVGSTGDPPVWTAPSVSGWGKWGIKLVVNGGLKFNVPNADMQDVATILEMDSASGVKDIAVGESTQFDPYRAALASLQADLRKLETALTGAAGAVVLPAIAPANDPTFTQLCWDFTEASGSTTINNNGALGNSAAYQLTLSGTAGKFSLNNPTSIRPGLFINGFNVAAGVIAAGGGVGAPTYQPTGNVSLCCVFIPNSVGNGTNVQTQLFGKAYSTSWAAPFQSIGLALSADGRVVGNLSRSGSQTSLTTATAFIVGQLNVAALTWNPTTGAIAVNLNGAETAGTLATGNVEYSNGNWYVGRNEGGADPFHGTILRATVENTVRSAAYYDAAHATLFGR